MLNVLLTLTGLLPRREERGATTAEYGLIAAGVLLVLVFGVDALRAALNLFFADQQNTVDGWVPTE